MKPNCPELRLMQIDGPKHPPHPQSYKFLLSLLSKNVNEFLADHARPYLQTLHGESKDYTYINAVEVDGFRRKSEFIVTEWPKTSTLDSFWTLVFDHSCHTIVNLSNQGHSRVSLPSGFNLSRKI